MTAPKISYRHDNIISIELNGTALAQDRGAWWLFIGEGEDCRVTALADQFGNLTRDVTEFADALGAALKSPERGYAYVSKALGIPLRPDAFGEQLLAIAAADRIAAAKYAEARIREDVELARQEIQAWEDEELQAEYIGMHAADPAPAWLS